MITSEINGEKITYDVNKKCWLNEKGEIFDFYKKNNMIFYMNYLAENLDNSICFTEYISEYVKINNKLIKYIILGKKKKALKLLLKMQNPDYVINK